MYTFLLIQYQLGNLTQTQLAKAVTKGLITEAQASDIMACNLAAM
jgi:hypothetical protein